MICFKTSCNIRSHFMVVPWVVLKSEDHCRGNGYYTDIQLTLRTLIHGVVDHRRQRIITVESRWTFQTVVGLPLILIGSRRTDLWLDGPGWAVVSRGAGIGSRGRSDLTRRAVESWSNRHKSGLNIILRYGPRKKL